MVRKIGREKNCETARHGMAHDGGPLPPEMGTHVQDVGKKRIQRIILVFAPARAPKAAVVKNDNLAVLGYSGRDVYPVVRIEVVAPMQDDQGRLARQAALWPKGTIKQRNISALSRPCSMQPLTHVNSPSCTSAT